MIKTLIIVCHLSTHGWQLNLSIFSSVQIANGPPERSKSSAWSLAMCETWITFKGLWYNHIITKGDFKHFKSLRSCFLKVTTKLDANSVPWGLPLYRTTTIAECNQQKHTQKANSHVPCRAHATPLPCCAKFTHAVLCPCHASTVPCP